MRYLLFLLLFILFTLNAQTSVKTIPGVFKGDINDSRLSSDGNSVVIYEPNGVFGFIDISKGTITKVKRNMTSVSPDNSYLYKNDSYSFSFRRNEKNQSGWAFNTSSIGIITDTIVRTITGYYALGMDDQNNFIATKVFGDSVETTPRLMTGLYRVDRLTGKELQVLRTDTLYDCRVGRIGDCKLPSFRIRKDHLGSATNWSSPKWNILPFGKKDIITAEVDMRDTYGGAALDNNFMYTYAGSDSARIKVNAYNIRTGKLQATKFYTRDNKGQHFFAFRDEKIYIYKNTEGIMYEDKVVRDSIVNSRTWKLNLNLSVNQQWKWEVTKGPYVFFYPLSLKNGEAGGETANTATLFNGASGKVSLKIYPFYNRSTDDITKEALAYKKQQKWMDSLENKKVAEKKRLCDPATVGGYKKGIAVNNYWGGGLPVIIKSYDCIKDEYRLWKPKNPKYPELPSSEEKWSTEQGEFFRKNFKVSDKQYQTCTDCDGDGRIETTEETTKTRDVLGPGWTSGVTTTRTTTTSTTKITTCLSCAGQGIILK